MKKKEETISIWEELAVGFGIILATYQFCQLVAATAALSYGFVVSRLEADIRAKMYDDRGATECFQSSLLGIVECRTR